MCSFGTSPLMAKEWTLIKVLRLEDRDITQNISETSMQVGGVITASTPEQAATVAKAALALGYQGSSSSRSGNNLEDACAPSSASEVPPPIANPKGKAKAKAAKSSASAASASTDANPKAKSKSTAKKVSNKLPGQVNLFQGNGTFDDALFETWMRQLNADITDGCKWRGSQIHEH